MKKCTKCEIEKELSEFQKDRYSKDGLKSRCRNCVNDSYNEFYRQNPDKQKIKNERQKQHRKNYYSSEKGIICSRKSHLKTKYGITLEDYNAMLIAQENKCAICKGFETHDKHGVLAVDHCHKTNKIRGLLCFKCNSVLGSVNDNIDILKQMINYLNN